uniref:Uncharacterized protein n=1 Tax=Salix viminalis TaxID=40686 RepID=A0A6N2N8I0_SALVM
MVKPSPVSNNNLHPINLRYQLNKGMAIFTNSEIIAQGLHHGLAPAQGPVWQQILQAHSLHEYGKQPLGIPK